MGDVRLGSAMKPFSDLPGPQNSPGRTWDPAQNSGGGVPRGLGAWPGDSQLSPALESEKGLEAGRLSVSTHAAPFASLPFLLQVSLNMLGGGGGVSPHPL